MICLNLIKQLLVFELIKALALDVSQDSSKEMISQGRQQYELLKKRSGLPKYGTCWQSAVEHIEGGCQILSEETQSNIALHLTNCFLEESGHETYNCEYDKKVNVKRICIAQMSDRAYNVYTEFYTHTQNICWFLRGQIWHELITENTFKVGKQLEDSVENQDKILASQKESLELQNQLLLHGQNLQRIMKDFELANEQHQRILAVMANSLGSLQSWLTSELSWFDLSIFYILTTIIMGIFTTNERTINSRLPLLFLLIVSISFERYLICFTSINGNETAHVVHKNIYNYIWWIRRIYLLLALFIIIYKAYSYKNVAVHNNTLLKNIFNQNLSIFDSLLKIRDTLGENGEPYPEERNVIQKGECYKNCYNIESELQLCELRSYNLRENTAKKQKNTKYLRNKKNKSCI